MFTPLTIGALIVAIVVLLGLLSIVKTTLKTALAVAVIVFVLQVVTGFGPMEIWAQFLKMLSGLGEWLEKWGGRARPPSDFRENQPPRSSGYNEIAMLTWYLLLWIH